MQSPVRTVLQDFQQRPSACRQYGQRWHRAMLQYGNACVMKCVQRRRLQMKPLHYYDAAFFAIAITRLISYATIDTMIYFRR